MSMRFACLLLVSASVAFTAPVLRLSQTVVTPQANVIQAYNAGDGTLSPGVSVASGVPWLSASVGGACPASSPPSCVLIQFNFNTASLGQGTYTASVTVFAPGAEDSPETVIAMAQVGGNPLAIVDSYLTTGTTWDVTSNAGCGFMAGGGNYNGPLPVSTNDGGAWLSGTVSVSTEIEGTIQFVRESCLIQLAPPVTMAPGIYTGNLLGSLPVTMNLVAQPLAVPSPSNLDLTLAQGGPALTFPFVPAISLNPEGMVPATSAAASGAGISASASGGNVIVTADPSSLAPGAYNGSITIGCAAVNCPVIVSVRLTVTGPGPPVLISVFDNVTFASGPVAPGEVMVVQGEQLSMDPPAYANGAPLPTTLGGASVLVNGVAAPLYYSSPNQIAFQLPASTTQSSLVQVQRDGQTSNSLGLTAVLPSAPQIAVITDTAYNLRDAYHPAHAGETIILWGIGLGITSPFVPDGAAAPSSPLAMTWVLPTVQFGPGVSLSHPVLLTAPPSFAGLSPGTVGLYQVNVTVPASTPSGNLSVKLIYPNVSNAVPLAIQ